jgi:hypothetical protein
MGHAHSHHAHQADAHHSHSHGQDGSCSHQVPYYNFRHNWFAYTIIGTLILLILNGSIYTWNKGKAINEKHWVPLLFNYGEYWFGHFSEEEKKKHSWLFYAVGDIIRFFAYPVLKGTVKPNVDARVNADKVADRSHQVRHVVTFLALMPLIIATIEAIKNDDNFHHFSHASAEVPEWATAFTALMMLINFAASSVGGTAKQHKVQRPYDTLMTIQAAYNHKKGESNVVAHGNDGGWARGLHTVNGIAGSGVSTVVFVGYVVALFTAPMIGAFTLGVMLFASRISALVSVIFAPATLLYRDKKQEKNVNAMAEKYVSSGKTDARITDAINSVFEDISDNNAKTLVKYSVCRACESFLKRNPQPTSVINETTLRDALSYCMEGNQISVKKIENAESLPFLDALPFIEQRVEAALLGKQKETPLTQIEGVNIASGTQERLLCLAFHNAENKDINSLYEENKEGLLKKENNVLVVNKTFLLDYGNKHGGAMHNQYPLSAALAAGVLDAPAGQAVVRAM